MVGVSPSEAGFSGLLGAPALPKQKGQKAGVHVGTMTQHLSRFAARALPVLPSALAPPSQTLVLFSGSEQSRRLGWGRGWGRSQGRAARWLMAAALFLPPSPVVVWSPEQAAVRRPGRALRVCGAQCPRLVTGEGARYPQSGPPSFGQQKQV